MRQKGFDFGEGAPRHGRAPAPERPVPAAPPPEPKPLRRRALTVSELTDRIQGVLAAIKQAQAWITEFKVPVVIEVMLERVTNISMGTEIDGSGLHPTSKGWGLLWTARATARAAWKRR